MEDKSSCTNTNDYQLPTLFNRVKFDIAGDLKNDQPTNQHLDSIKAGSPDNYIAELKYQFGCYLLVSSLKSITLSASLQGILAELHKPFLEYVGNLKEMGRLTDEKKLWR